MPGPNEAFSRAKNGTWLKDQGWRLLDINAVRFEYVLPNKTRADDVLCAGNCRRQADVLTKAEATFQALLSRAFSGDLTAAGSVPEEAVA